MTTTKKPILIPRTGYCRRRSLVNLGRRTQQAGVDQVNRQLPDVEQIMRFLLVGEEWLPDSELLTPTSKLKRRSVNSRYAAEIDALYTDVN